MNLKKLTKMALDIYYCAKVLEDYCKFNESEDISPMKPIINSVKKQADELWYFLDEEMEKCA